MDDFNLLVELGRVDPPDLMVTARVAAVLDGAAGESTVGKPRRHRNLLHLRPLAVVGISMIVLVVAVISLVASGGGLSSPITSSWQAGHEFSIGGGSSDHSRHGTWALMDDVLSGTWQQNLSGPPPGDLTCSDSSTCFVMSGNYVNDEASSPTSDSLYASSDFGSTWTAFSMPSGFLSTSSLVCSGAVSCAVGGTYNGQPVLVTTNDGGHSFVINPLPSGDGTINSLSCPTATLCVGLAGTATEANLIPADATLLATTDGGVHFSDTPIIAGDSMEQIVCTSREDCTTIGVSDGPDANNGTSGVAAVTINGGQTWSSGPFPTGFGIAASSEIACSDSLHCSVIGDIQIPVANSPMCSGLTSPTTKSTPTTPPPQSTAVRQISTLEYQYAIAAIRSANNDTGSCLGGSNNETISDLASTSDGGLSWTPEQLPSDTPQPLLTGIDCPSSNECWASGSAALYQHVGRLADQGNDGGSSVLLGTTDGGTTWSRVVFSVPRGAPNFEGQSFLSTASISCPTTDDCAANGSGAQSAPSAPMYTLQIPDQPS